MKTGLLSSSDTGAIASNLGCILTGRKFTCAVAESCTGGMVGAAITSVAGSSDWFRGGVIAYSNDVKIRLLGVPEQVLVKHGAVSADTVAAMALGAAKLLEADCTVAVSGVAGPGGGTDEKPVGLVFIGVFVCGTIATFRHLFAGDRAAVRGAAAAAALQHLIDQI